jgi:hypothetical protein
LLFVLSMWANILGASRFGAQQQDSGMMNC